MNLELERIHKELRKAVAPEDVFGTLSQGDINSQLDKIKSIYWKLSKTVFPDHYRSQPEDFKMAEEAFRILNEFTAKARSKINGENHGEKQDTGFIIKRPNREYHVNSKPIAEGDISMVYGGHYSGVENGADSIVAKVIKDSADADLMRNEARIIRILQTESSNQSKHLPKILDQFRTTDKRTGLILERFDGYDFYSVREKYKDGVPEKHMVWMLNRLLSVLGYAHSKGVVHCNIEPAHLMIRPYDHNLCLLDWSYGVVNPFATGEGFKVFNEDFSAPEVREKKTPIPASDLYSAGKCMIYILGGDIKWDWLPNSVDARLQRFIKFFVMKSPIQRAQDAWEIREELVELIEDLWGPRKFLDFEM